MKKSKGQGRREKGQGERLSADVAAKVLLALEEERRVARKYLERAWTSLMLVSVYLPSDSPANLRQEMRDELIAIRSECDRIEEQLTRRAR